MPDEDEWKFGDKLILNWRESEMERDIDFNLKRNENSGRY